MIMAILHPQYKWQWPFYSLNTNGYDHFYTLNTNDYDHFYTLYTYDYDHFTVWAQMVMTIFTLSIELIHNDSGHNYTLNTQLQLAVVESHWVSTRTCPAVTVYSVSHLV